MDSKDLLAAYAEGKRDFTGANLRIANLTGADLRNANLRSADLTGADLRIANLRIANLRNADLTGADLRNADLRSADLTGADLRNADLRSADLTGANLPHFRICPEEGSFTCYKKLDTGVIALTIPAEAKRTSSLVGRKCRAEFVMPHGSGTSGRGGEYVEGQMYYPDSYDDDIRVECTHGVHFFITRREAEEYSD